MLRPPTIVMAMCLCAGGGLLSPAEADVVTIEHSGVGCVVAGKFVQLDARLVPADQVARARVQFRGSAGGPWYFVDMKPVAGVYTGFLPRPLKTLKKLSYYVEVVDRAFGQHRTPEYAPQVAEGPGSCGPKTMMATVGTVTSVAVGGPSGAAAVPAGFSSAGVTTSVAAGGAAAGSAAAAGTTAGVVGGAAVVAAATGGGISTGLLIAGGVVLAGGAATAAVVAGKGGSGDSGSKSQAYSGTFNGQYVVTENIGAAGPAPYTCLHTHSFSGVVNVVVDASAGHAVATGTDTEVGVTGPGAVPGQHPGCSSPGPLGSLFFGCPFMGGAGDLTCSDQKTATSGTRTSTESHQFSGGLSGGVITGVVTYTNAGQTNGPGGFAATDSSSATFPVTLR
jgi:hypothetical protein